MSSLRCLFLRLILAPCFLVSDASSVPAQMPQQSPTYRDVVYGNADPAQKLDVYLAESDQPTPVMVFIHGGGMIWMPGPRETPRQSLS